MEREIAARTFGYVPAGKPIRFVHDTVADGVVGALGGATAALGRGAEAVVARRPRPQRPLSATLPGGLGLAALNGLVGDRLERERSPLQEPISIRVDGLPVALERDELAARLPGRHPAARRLRPRPDGQRGGLAARPAPGPRALRHAARARARLHPGLRPLQQRPPHLRERALARRPARGHGRRVAGRGRRGRARRALDGRARRAQRLPPRRQGRRRLGPARAPRDLARLAPPGRAARAGRPRRELRVRQAARDAHALDLPAPPQLGHPRPPAGLARRRGLARPRSRGAARRGLRGGAAARGRDALLRLGDRHAQPAPPGRPGRRRHAGAPAERLRAAAARASSASRTSTGSTSAPRTTSRCSTTPPSTRSCGSGWR